MKGLIVNTALGRLALSTRHSLELVTAALRSPESVGTVGNDHLAAILTTRLCLPGKVFIDIGAHIGSVVSEVARRCPSARLVAVEAIPAKAENLRRRFPNVECHSCALGDSEGEVSFFIDLEKSGYSSLEQPTRGGSSAIQEIKVPLRRLDSLISSDRVDVIKIDVEGAELGVLRGGQRLVDTSRPTIMFESGPSSAPDDPSKQLIWTWLAERSYAVLVPNRVAHHDPGLSLEGFLESHLYPRRTTNYFAIPLERRQELRDRARSILELRPSSAS